MRSEPDGEPWAAVEEVAKHRGVANDSVHRWIEKKSLPACRMGRLWQFRISEVDEWVLAGGAGEPDSNEDAAQKRRERPMSLSLKDAARKVLAEAGEPLHDPEITTRILDGGLSPSRSKTPAASRNAARRVATLEEQFAESARLEKAIRKNLEVLGFAGGGRRVR